MANSQTQMSPPPFSPGANSPTNPMSPSGTQYPPNKRARMSPSQSPFASPQMPNGQLPTAGYSPQFDAGSPNGYHSHIPGEFPSNAAAGTMGPPSRPVEEKAPGIDDLSDVLYGSGIDIREEETALQNRVARANQGLPYSSQSTSFGASFEVSQPLSIDSHTAPHYAANVPGGRDSFFGAGTFNQAPVSPEVVHQHTDQAKRERIRRMHASKQFELADPFLSSRAMWQRLQKETTTRGIKVPPQGGGLPQQQSYRVDTFTVGGPQNQNLRPLGETLTVVPSEGLVADALTLISLATRERIRTLIEDAGTIARGRRETAHGVVPADIQDMVSGIGKPVETTYEESPRANPLKRTQTQLSVDAILTNIGSYSEANALPSPVSDDQSQAKRLKTIAYPNLLAASAAKMQAAQRKVEEARAERRGKRKASGVIAGEQSRASSTAGTPTPGTPGEVAPRISKKEQKKQADARANEAQQHAATNNAVSMALGGSLVFGQKKKKISWMTSKQPATDSFAPPKRAASSQQIASAGKGTSSSGPSLGTFREDKEGGRGIQLRDIIHILEPDLREKRALSKAYFRQRSRR